MNIKRGRSQLTIAARYAMYCALCASCSAGPNEPPAADQPTAAKGTAFKVIATPQRKGDTVTKEKPKVGHLDVRMQGFVAATSKQLAAKLKVSVDQIELVEASYVTWRDSSLGCPQSGTQYMQALVNGTRIKLRSAGKVYHFHGGGSKPPTLCENPTSNEPLPYGSGDA